MPGYRVRGERWPREERTAAVMIRLTPEMKKKWEAYLLETRKGLSVLIRHAVSEWIKKHPHSKSVPWDA